MSERKKKNQPGKSFCMFFLDSSKMHRRKTQTSKIFSSSPLQIPLPFLMFVLTTKCQPMWVCLNTENKTLNFPVARPLLYLGLLDVYLASKCILTVTNLVPSNKDFIEIYITSLYFYYLPLTIM